MPFRWIRRRVQKRRAPRTRTAKERSLYAVHKEEARVRVHERLLYWNAFYNFTYNRVAIRDQRSRWGSCSSKQNLNFNYRLIFLPPELFDYVIVHELCHLAHLNHGKDFWDTVARMLPDFRLRKEALALISPHIQKHIEIYAETIKSETMILNAVQ